MSFNLDGSAAPAAAPVAPAASPASVLPAAADWGGDWSDWGGDWGSFGKMMMEASRAFMGPYGGGGGGGGKGKGKGKQFQPKPPKVNKPDVNPNQINPAKGIFEGGVSFKNILQEKISKDIKRPIAPGDLNYTAVREPGVGVRCTLTLPGVTNLPGLQPGQSFETDVHSKDEKQAGQVVAAQAMRILYADLYDQVMEAYNSGAGEDPEGEPKSLLNSRVQAKCGRPIVSSDILYETTYKAAIRGYVCKLTLNALREGNPEAPIFEAEVPNSQDRKAAEKAAARLVLMEYKADFDAAVAAKQAAAAAKARAAAAAKGKGKSKAPPSGVGAGAARTQPSMLGTVGTTSGFSSGFSPAVCASPGFSTSLMPGQPHLL